MAAHCEACVGKHNYEADSPRGLETGGSTDVTITLRIPVPGILSIIASLSVGSASGFEVTCAFTFVTAQ